MNIVMLSKQFKSFLLFLNKNENKESTFEKPNLYLIKECYKPAPMVLSLES